MSGQEEGLLGRYVGRMIRRSVRQRFKGLYWMPPSVSWRSPVIFVPNHHGWFDGYVMFHVVTKFGLRTLDWIQEFDAFPLFSRIGGLPYPLNNPLRRARTVWRTIRLMQKEKRSLLLFAEGELHYPPDLLSFGRALETIAEKVPGVTVVPVAIRYEAAMHERPECFIGFGEPVALGPDLCERTRAAVGERLELLLKQIREERDGFEVLAKGTDDVNERWDMRRLRGTKR